MENHLDYAYELSRAESKADTYELKKLINEIRFYSITDENVNWKEYLFKLLDMIGDVSQRSYNEGYKDALYDYGIE